MDLNTESHIRGIDIFWGKIQNYFSKSRIQGIEIVVVVGETTILRTTDSSQNARCSNEELDTKKGNKLEDIEEESSSVENDISGRNGYNSDTDSKCASVKDSLSKELGIVKTMEQYIKKKIEADFEMNRSRIQFDSKFAGKDLRMNIRFSVVNSSLDFQSLRQKWSRDSIDAATKVLCGQSSPVISFRLPETTYFDSCQLSFSAYYKNMPFRLDSSRANALYDDLELLGRAHFEVLQLVPMPSIDASLIYGVAIGLRAAEKDFEKQILVASLLKNLGIRDCGE